MGTFMIIFFLLGPFLF